MKVNTKKKMHTYLIKRALCNQSRISSFGQSMILHLCDYYFRIILYVRKIAEYNYN